MNFSAYFGLEFGFSQCYHPHLSNVELHSGCRLDLIDESHKHAGHAAMKGLNKAETHFNLAVVSSSFEGLTTIKRHKLVYKASHCTQSTRYAVFPCFRHSAFPSHMHIIIGK